MDVGMRVRVGIANAIVAFWLLATIPLAAIIRAFEPSHFLGMMILLVIYSSVLAIIPTGLIYYGLRVYRKHSIRLLILFSLVPAVLAEIWFLPEEISFHLWVGGQLEQSDETEFWRSRRWPFEMFSMGYAEESGYIVMD